MHRAGMLRTFVVAAACGALAMTGASAGAAGQSGPSTSGRTVQIQILQYSDWHGAISTAPQFAALVEADEAANPNTLLVTGGDDFGGTEPVSSLNDDIPAIEVQNLLGTDVAGLGNHNFDGGIDNLQAKIDLADYPYISSNLSNLDENGLEEVAPYVIFDFPRDVRVAFIGFTNEDAPSLVFPGNFGTIEVTDQVAALQAAREQAAAEDADIFIAIGHEGVRSVDTANNADGELIDLAEQLEGFDAVLGDHTDVQFVGEVGGALVSETRSHGASYHRITLTVKPGSGKIVDADVDIVPIAANGPADPEMAALVQPYYESLAAKFDQVIGQSGGFWRRGSGYERIGESELGNLFADATLASAPNADVALLNSGGIRSSLSPSNYIASDPSVDRDLVYPDDIVVGDLFSLHNFGNIVSTQTVTGAQLRDAVEHGLSTLPGAAGSFPVIAGFQVIYDTSLPVGSRVLSMTLDDGTPIADDPSQLLVLATNNFLSAGGDNYTMLADPTATTRDLLTSALGDYISAAGLITPYFDCRLVDQNPTGAAATRAFNPLGPLATRADCAA